MAPGGTLHDSDTLVLCTQAGPIVVTTAPVHHTPPSYVPPPPTYVSKPPNVAVGVPVVGPPPHQPAAATAPLPPGKKV